ncbi:hypothetical protein F4777DRAFT_539358 [Nemania sp. FL0916]|nr:hypothetical protein F4777DRAFT_539358 [Nemania sp. FL0916]
MASKMDHATLSAKRLAKAKAYYNDSKYGSAAILFKRVADQCACGVRTGASSCHCKSLSSAIADGVLEAELRKKCICSARSDVRCRSADHIDALDGLANAYWAKGQTDAAVIVAESMIHLAPREPKSYLRFGKLFRVQNLHRRAYQTYCQGIELVSKKNASHPLLPTLHQMKDKTRYKALASDPLSAVPLEIAVMIFAKLNFRTLCNCLRVSKSWKSLLTGGGLAIQSLWRIQHFNPCTKPITLRHYKNYATYAGFQVSELVIQDASKSRLDNASLAWIISSVRNLKALKLQSSETFQLPYLSGSCHLQLTSLYFGRNITTNLGTLALVITGSAATLQELTVLNADMHLGVILERLTDEHGPILERLRILRLASLRPSVRIDIRPYARACPNVEELLLDGEVMFTYGEDCCFSRLKKLFIGNNISCDSMVDGLFFPLGQMEELYLMSQQVGGCLGMFLEQFDDLPEDTSPKNLRNFAHRGDFGEFSQLERLGLESGSLKELGTKVPGSLPDWFRSEELKILGINHHYDDSYAYNLTDEPISDLLERFPNLEVLSIGERSFSDAALAKAIQKGVKKIYYRGTYWERNVLREWAHDKYGAQVIKGDYIYETTPMYLQIEP